MKITQVNYNWRFSQENGEEFSHAIVGYNGVKEIEEHLPAGHGDALWYDIIRESGNIDRIFNINQVFFEPKTT